MTCKELADFLLEYTAGELPDDARVVFEEHLNVCANCREYLAIYRTTVTLGRYAFDAASNAVDAGVPEELVSAILAARPSRR